MINFKLSKRLFKTSYLEDIKEYLSDIRSDIRWQYGRLKRFFKWGWRGLDIYEWDYGSMETLMKYQMDDLAESFEQDDIHCWCNDRDSDEYPQYKAFKICYKLIKRLTERDSMCYAINSEKKHEKKWGKLNFEFENQEIKIWRNNCKTKEDEKQESRERLSLITLNERVYLRDRRILFNLLEKYGHHWWV